MPETIDNLSFAEFLNPAAKKDSFFVNAARALDPLLADIRLNIANNVILAALDKQSASTLDFLALYHFNIDTWDLSYTYSQKLALLRSAIEDKVIRGTPAAVKKTLSIAFNSAKIIEWWADTPPRAPNTFRILINDPLVDPARVSRLIDMVIKTKNARSWFAGISSFTAAPTDTLYIGGSLAEYEHLTVPYTPTIL
jgi:phage tail P2-like protein